MIPDYNEDAIRLTTQFCLRGVVVNKRRGNYPSPVKLKAAKLLLKDTDTTDEHHTSETTVTAVGFEDGNLLKRDRMLLRVNND